MLSLARRRFLPAVLMLACLICAPVRADGDSPEAPVPTEDQARATVDTLIKQFTDAKKPATLGLIAETIEDSIAYGAPTYNSGDRAGCFRFYAKTAQSLLDAFPKPENATEPARKALADLRAALDRSRKFKGDLDRGAWSIRLAFDKTDLAVQVTTESAGALVRMGGEYFHRSQFEESQDAFQSATEILAELDGRSPDRLPIEVRFASLGLGHALFAQEKFADASAAIVSGLSSMPEWPSAKIDLRSLHSDPAEYEAILGHLETAAANAPSSAPLQFLLGYEYWFTGKRDAARMQFGRTLKIDPNHPGAKSFLDATKSLKLNDAKPA